MARSPRAERPVDSMRNFERWPGTYVRLDLDRQAVLVERRALEEERRQAALLAEQAGLATRQQDRLERLAAAARRGSRSAGPGSRTASRAPGRRPGAPGTAPRAGGPARAGAARPRHSAVARGRPTGAPGARPRISATASLAGSRRAVSSSVRGCRPRSSISSAKLNVEVRSRTIRGRRHERAPAAGPLQALLAGEVGQGPADRDQAAAVALGELALRRQAVARPPSRRSIRASRST